MAPDPSRQPYRRVLRSSYRILTPNADMRYSTTSSDREWAGRPAHDRSNRPEDRQSGPWTSRTDRLETPGNPLREFGGSRVQRSGHARAESRLLSAAPEIGLSRSRRESTTASHGELVSPACTSIRPTCSGIGVYEPERVRRGRVNGTEAARSACREAAGSEDHDWTRRSGESRPADQGGVQPARISLPGKRRARTVLRARA